MKNYLSDIVQRFNQENIEVVVETSKAKRVKKRQSVIEDISTSYQFGGQIRLYKNNRMYFAVFTDVHYFETIMESLIRLANFQGNKWNYLTHSSFYESHEPLTLFPNMEVADNFGQTIDYLSQKYSVLSESIPLHLDIINYGAISKEKLYLNSAGKMLSQTFTDHTFSRTCFIRKKGNLRNYTISAGGVSLDKAEAEFDQQVDKLVNMYLKDLPIIDVPSGMYDVILDYEFAGTLIHETIGHLAEADNLTSNLYKELKGKQVASEILNVCDDPRYKDLKGSYLFDDQGENAQSTVLCNHGALCNFLSDRKTSELYDIPITGNSRSINYSHLPLVRMSNLFVQPGETDLDEMIGNIDYGLFVVGAKSAITNNAQFRISANAGFIIKNGNIIGMTNDIVLSGNLDTLKSIHSISRTQKTLTGMFCTKGNQRNLPVSATVPEIKLRCYVEEI